MEIINVVDDPATKRQRPEIPKTEFDYNELSDKEKAEYNKLSDKNKKAYETQWVKIYKQKLRMKKMKDDMKAIADKDKRAARKEENHIKYTLGGGALKFFREHNIDITDPDAIARIVYDFLDYQEKKGGYFTSYMNKKFAPAPAAPMEGGDQV